MMNTNNVPAPAGKKVRALFLSALIVSIMAGTLFVPAMAQSDANYCNACSPPDENGMQICTMQYCGPVIFPKPLPPCCVYGPFGEPYCFGEGMCRMDRIPLVGQESRN